MPNEDLCSASAAARNACWSTVGQVDSDVLGHIINPAFMGGPRWPALRQAFAVVRRPETQTVILASDGLSDPWDGQSPARTVPWAPLIVCEGAQTRVCALSIEIHPPPFMADPARYRCDADASGWINADGEGAEENENGLGLEFYVETPAEDIAGEVGDMVSAWQFQLLYQISQLAASSSLPCKAPV